LSTTETIYISNNLSAGDTLEKFIEYWIDDSISTNRITSFKNIITFEGDGFSIDSVSFQAPEGPKSYVQNLVKFNPTIRLSLFYSRNSDVEKIRDTLIKNVIQVVSSNSDWNIGLNFEYEGLALIYRNSKLYIDSKHMIWNSEVLDLLPEGYIELKNL